MNNPSIRTIEVNERRAVIAEAINKSLEVFCYHSELAFDEIMNEGLRPIAKALDISRITVCRYVETDDGKRLAQTYRWDKSNGVHVGESIDLMSDNQAIAEWLKILRQNLCVNKRLGDMSGDEAAVMNVYGIKSVLMVPVFTRGKFWGSLIFQDTVNERHFDDGCMDLMQSAALLCANAIMHTDMERKVADKNEFNQVMFDSAPVGLTMLDENAQFVDCNEAVLTMYGITKEHYRDHFFDLSPEYQPDGTKSIDKFRDILKRTIGGEKMVLEWMHQAPDGEPIPCEITLTRIKHDGKYIALGYVYDLRHIKKMEESIRLLETEAEKIYYDALTGIYNRRYFDENLSRVIRILSRSGGKLGLMMIDIDFFKNYNDTYGHSSGDTCLKIIAQALAKSVTRADDFVARYGGEEFVAVLPNTDENGVCIVAEKLLENVRACNILHEESDAAGYVTVSVGVTASDVSHTQGVDDYVKRADEMLYKSKQNGRNQYNFGCL